MKSIFFPQLGWVGMRVRAALLTVPLLFALLVVPAAGTALLPAGAPDGASAQTAAPTLQSDGSNESTVNQVFRINVTDDGDARWIVTSRVHDLDTQEDRQAFRDLAAEYEAGQTDTGYSTATFEPFAANASDVTGREMAIVNESRSTRLVNGTGYLSFSFTWTNFATVDDDLVVLGDVFQTGSGTWLSGVEDGQRLVISPPPGYAVDSLSFGALPDGGLDSGTLTWTGPVSFADSDLGVTYVATDGPTGPTGPPTDPSSDGIVLLGVGLAAIVGGLALGGYVLRGRDDAVAQIVTAIPGAGDDPTADDGNGTSPAGRSTSPAGSDDAASDDGGPAVAADDAGTATAAGDADVESPDDPSTADATDASSDLDDGAAAGAAGAAAADASDADGDDADEVDPELLSDEERVERLLRENGGRMKQATIVTETGWSNAKVSQLLSAMDEDDRVDKLRIGRENLISLPDEDVTEVE